jgi:hypothetical protein
MYVIILKGNVGKGGLNEGDIEDISLLRANCWVVLK